MFTTLSLCCEKNISNHHNVKYLKDKIIFLHLDLLVLHTVTYCILILIITLSFWTNVSLTLGVVWSKIKPGQALPKSLCFTFCFL